MLGVLPECLGVALIFGEVICHAQLASPSKPGGFPHIFDILPVDLVVFR